jgi:threonine dehydratase
LHDRHLTIAPALADVHAAAARITGHAVVTPLLRSDALDALTGARVFLKAECLQLTGSFKFRGAMNRLAQLPPGTPVVAFSSGNHAQGVARAARLLGLACAIVMPADAPAVKVARTRADGAEIIFYDRAREDRAVIAAELADERGAVVVPSFDDPAIIAGQGTAGLEARAQLAALGLVADVALVCCGGGGLASGIAVGLGAPVVTVEPEGYDDVARSLAGGAIVGIDGFAPTLADALQTARMAPLTFAILSAHGARGVAVSEAAMARAVAFAFGEMRLVVEPGGAAALAALLSGVVDVRGQVVLATLSGGNVDPATFARLIGA